MFFYKNVVTLCTEIQLSKKLFCKGDNNKHSMIQQ